jgi:hypothetical protein
MPCRPDAAGNRLTAMDHHVRYLYTTRGEYVAFVAAGFLFTPDCAWLGVVDSENDVFDPEGAYIAKLQPDGRLVRSLAGALPRRIMRPRRPLLPARPIPPGQQLFMPPVGASNEDVFLGARRPLTVLTPLARLTVLDALRGAALVAADGTFLGRISRDTDDDESLAPIGGAHGSRYAERSIFNAAGPYGSADSPLSPYHPTSGTPPRIELEGEAIGLLSVNRDLPGRVHPDELVAWLKLGGCA